jgi:hypothetical protein
MSKYNKPSAVANRTTNLAGGEAFQESPKLEFVSHLLTSFVKDQYYRSEKEGVKRLKELMDLINDKKFLAKAAIYARTKFGMRSVSHIVAGEIAKTVKGQEWTKFFFDKIIHRPDDMMEILAYYYQNAKNEPQALRKGFAKAFARFSAYQLAKYKKEGSEVSLIDVANVVHPVHTKAVEALIKGTLKPAETWEKKLTQAGQVAGTEEEKDNLKKDAWVSLIKERKIGYFALIRNLRNIIEQAPEVLPEALALLTDEKMIKDSLVLPFRLLTAADEIAKLSGREARSTVVALNKALDISVANVPKFDGETLVALDISGSMGGRTAEIAGLFAAMLIKANNADLIRFDNHAEYMSINPMDSTITIANQISESRGGTDLGSPLEEANRCYDRIVYISDMQGWVGYYAPTRELEQYKRRLNANPRIYSFDMAGEGTLQFPEQNIYALAGFSEKTFDIMALLEQDRNALINEIEKVEL